MRILVVDHDAESLQRAVAQLGNLGFDATGTLEEDEAHERLGDHDLLVRDVLSACTACVQST